MAERPREFEKDPVDALIIVGGCILGGIIIIGFIGITLSIVHWWNMPVSNQSGISLEQTAVQSQTEESSGECTNCLSQSDNNHTYTVYSGDIITLELPLSTYARGNLFLTANPSGVLLLGRDMPARLLGDWAVTIRASGVGTGDIIVKANDGTQSDFHVTLVIQNKS